MEQKLRKIIREYLEEIIDEAYPTSFDMETFKSLKSHSARNKYAAEHLQRLSSGSSRIVYKIDEEKVLKLAKNDKGVAQNEVEISHGQDDYLRYIVARVFDHDLKNLWLEMELARKLTKSEFKKLTGFNFDDFAAAIANHEIDVRGHKLSYKYKQQIDSKIADAMWENEFIYGIFDYIGSYDVPAGDFQKLSSFGIVKRNGQDEIVLIDYGLSEEVQSAHYS